jgi:hypothetical protein
MGSTIGSREEVSGEGKMWRDDDDDGDDGDDICVYNLQAVKIMTRNFDALSPLLYTIS